jgi:CRP-like cAMP-binding protein
MFSAVAWGDCRLVVWKRKDLNSILAANGPLAVRFTEEAIGQLMDLVELCKFLVVSSAERRLRYALLELAAAFGVETDAGVLLTGFTGEDLAAMVSMNRFTVSHQLAKWRSKGWVKVSRKEILIVNVDAIVALVAVTR